MLSRGGMLCQTGPIVALAGLAWTLTAVAVRAEEFQYQAFTRDDQRITGKLTGNTADAIRFVKSDGVELPLDKIQSLDLPSTPRILPDRGWKRARLVNGDVLHVKLNPQPQSPEPQTRVDQATLPTWFTSFESSAKLPLSRLASLSHSPGTRTLVYEDFESDASGWQNSSGKTMNPNRDHGRSGMSGLKCSIEEPAFHFALPQPLRKGCAEFSFYIDPQTEPSGDCTALFRFHGPQPVDIKVKLVGMERWYEVQEPPAGIRQQQNILRRPGWHTVSMKWLPTEVQLTVDGFQLAQGKLAHGEQLELREIGISSALTSGGVWIDDFALVEPVAKVHSTIVQRDSDQLDLFSGDQLFGKLSRIEPRSIIFTTNMQMFPVPWSDVAELRIAMGRTSPTSVNGWLARIDLQPWNDAPDLEAADSIRGALLSVDRDGCQLDHPLCGHLTIPWQAVRRLQPAYRGQEWVLEGRPRHLGNEVKSAFSLPSPEGTRLSWSVELPTVPTGVAFVALTAIDLEPAAPETRPNRWLEQLRKGSLTSELWINERRVAVLNEETSGRGTADQPRRLRIRLPAGSLVAGKNEVSLRLKPSSGMPLEYDDWELRDLRLELEASP